MPKRKTVARARKTAYNFTKSVARLIKQRDTSKEKFFKSLVKSNFKLSDTELQGISKYETFYKKYAEKNLQARMKYPTDMESIKKRYTNLFNRASSVGFDPKHDYTKNLVGFIKKKDYKPNAISQLNMYRTEFVERAMLGLDRTEMSEKEKELAMQGIRRFANRASASELSRAYRSWFGGIDSFYLEDDEGRHAFFQSLDEAISHKKYGKGLDLYKAYVNIH